MDINFRGPGWPPIYFDPTWEELVELLKSFDTLRIGFVDTPNGESDLVLASGFGNTHNTLARALGEMNPHLKPSPRDNLKYGRMHGTCIFFEDAGRYWFNLSDFGAAEYTTPSEAIHHFRGRARRVVKDILQILDITY